MSRNLLESLIIILIALTFGMVLTLPKYQELQDLKRTEADKATQLKNRQEYFKELAKISSDLKKYDTNLVKIKSALPADPAVASFANFIQSSSSQSGLILKNLAYGASDASVSAKNATASNTGGYAVQVYDMTISLSGSYSAFKDFLSKMESSSRLIEIQEISFTVSQASIETKKTVSETAVAAPAGTATPESDEQVKGPEMTYEFSVRVRAHYY